MGREESARGDSAMGRSLKRNSGISEKKKRPAVNVVELAAFCGKIFQEEKRGAVYSSSPSRPSTGVIVPKRPSCSPLMPAVKNKVFAGPAFASLPKVRDQSPSMVRTESSGVFTKPMNVYVKPLKAAILPL